MTPMNQGKNFLKILKFKFEQEGHRRQAFNLTGN